MVKTNVVFSFHSSSHHFLLYLLSALSFFTARARDSLKEEKTHSGWGENTDEEEERKRKAKTPRTFLSLFDCVFALFLFARARGRTTGDGRFGKEDMSSIAYIFHPHGLQQKRRLITAVWGKNEMEVVLLLAPQLIKRKLIMRLARGIPGKWNLLVRGLTVPLSWWRPGCFF